MYITYEIYKQKQKNQEHIYNQINKYPLSEADCIEVGILCAIKPAFVRELYRFSIAPAKLVNNVALIAAPIYDKVWACALCQIPSIPAILPS